MAQKARARDYKAEYASRSARAKATGTSYGKERYKFENERAKAHGYKSVGEERKIAKLYKDYDIPLTAEGRNALGYRMQEYGPYDYWPDSDSLEDMDWDDFREWYGGGEIS